MSSAVLPLPVLLTVADLAIAWQVDPATIRGWARAGRIEGAEQKGRLWRFAPDARYIPPPPPTTPAEDLDELLAWSPKRAA